MPKIFINYRVRDQAGYAALLYRELSENFGSSAVFFASRSIQPGQDFTQGILDNVRRCEVLLAVIGPEWHLFNEPRRRTRLGGEDDWVGREISEAFAAGVRVIPVLVEDARLPAEETLDESIAAMSRCQYLRMHHRSIDSDLARVVRELRRIVPGLSDRAAGLGTDPHLDQNAGRSPEAVDPDVRLFRLASPGGVPRHLGIVAGSIHRVRCADIWVNSENTDMEMARFTDFSVSAIIRYWGARRDHAGWVTSDDVADELSARVGDRRPVTAGTAIATGPGALAASNNVRYLIHVAAVQGEPGVGFRQVRDVGRCVTNVLVEADRLASGTAAQRSGGGAVAGPPSTILFPLLGTGEAGAAVGPTVRTMTAAVIDYFAVTAASRLRVVYFLAYTWTELTVLDDVLGTAPRLVGETSPSGPPPVRPAPPAPLPVNTRC